ncbi:MAG: HEPN domain-containing protein [Planctomycetes bacterium]|nr:HEPN domain-containing protein [Planctomycetota bacterium]
MSVRDEAEMLIAKAQEDLLALSGMIDSNFFVDAVFGFHAQQAVEKSLKAWIAVFGGRFPYTHNLSVLFDMLASAGRDIEQFRSLQFYSPFAVTFRYEGKEQNLPAIPNPRPTEVERVKALVDHVASIIGSRQTRTDDA